MRGTRGRPHRSHRECEQEEKGQRWSSSLAAGRSQGWRNSNCTAERLFRKEELQLQGVSQPRCPIVPAAAQLCCCPGQRPDPGPFWCCPVVFNLGQLPHVVPSTALSPEGSQGYSVRNSAWRGFNRWKKQSEQVGD